MGSTDFPGLHPGSERWQGFPPEEWHDCPGRPGLRRRILAVRTEDDHDLTIHNIRGEARADRAARCSSSTAPACARTSSTARPWRTRSSTSSSTEGYDVWLGNWRGSIDLPECDYTLDDVARYDHPALIAAVLRETGASTLKAVVHCQGSTSFALAVAGGLVPEVTDVVSNAVSFHVDVPTAVQAPDAGSSCRSSPSATRASTRSGRCARPRCALACSPLGRAPCAASAASRCARWPTTPTAWAATSCGTTRTSTRPPTAGSPASSAGCRSPSSSRCRAAPRRGTSSRPPATTRSPRTCVASAPRNRPRWTFLAGSANRCFLARSQERSFAWLDGLEPGRHALVELPGYTHLDVFFGRNAERDVFAHVVGATARNFQPPGELESAERGLLWKPQHSTRRQVSVASRPAVRCCGCAPTTSSWRSSGWATTRRSGPSTTATASGCSPTRARCWAPRARTPRTSCRTSSCAPTARCATTTGR